VRGKLAAFFFVQFPNGQRVYVGISAAMKKKGTQHEPKSRRTKHVALAQAKTLHKAFGQVVALRYARAPAIQCICGAQIDSE
jgi:hypothetical protein